MRHVFRDSGNSVCSVNAEEHPLMNRFCTPGEETQPDVIVPRDAYEDWLGCHNTDEARSFLSLYPADEMAAKAAPLPPRKPVQVE
jgi:hypothetical protein